MIKTQRNHQEVHPFKMNKNPSTILKLGTNIIMLQPLQVFGSKQNYVLTATEMNFPTFLKAAIITSPI
jgi:hypothetical protein